MVWRDINGNGLQDDGSNTGISGVSLSLYRDDNDGLYEPDADDVFVSQSVTDSAGHYQLSATIAGYYWVVVDESTLAGLQPTLGSQSHSSPELLWAAAGKLYNNIDFGYSATGYLWGTVFYDRNLDGMQGLKDDGVIGAEVCLYDDIDGDGNLDSTDPQLSCTLTDIQGNYRFTDLFLGNYLVQETQQDGVGHTTPFIRAVALNPWKATSAQIEAFADVLLASASGRLYVDANGNGVRDPTETKGVAQALVTATCQDTGETFTTQTDNSGNYALTDLMPATYTISVSSTLSGFIATDASSKTQALEFGSQVTDIDFGYMAPTGVTLTDLTVSATEQGNLLQWETGPEQDLEGFVIWRATAENGKYKAISSLIPARNLPTGAEYQWRDTQIDGTTHFWYKIECKPDGVLFGPVSVQPEPGDGEQTLFFPMVIH